MRKILPLALTLCLVFILTTPVFAVLDAPMPNEVFESQEVYFYGRISNLASDCSSVTFEYCYQGGESNLYYNVYLYKSNYKQPWKETPLQKRSGRISSAAGYYTGSYTFDLQGYETGEYYICTFLGDAQGNLLEGTTKNKCYFQIYPENEESPVQAIFFNRIYPSELSDRMLESDTICAGASRIYNIEVWPDYSTGNLSPSFTVSDPSVVSIQHRLGLLKVTTLKNGQATITATTSDGISASLVVTVGHFYEDVDYVQPTCTEDGYVIERCVDCGAETRRVTPATGHYFTTLEILQESTCTEHGLERVLCHCGYTTERELPLRDHSYDSSWINPDSTATKPGKLCYHCNICDQTIENTLPAWFEDTDPNSYYSDAVDYLYAEGIINGVAPRQFGPSDPLDRAMVITMLYRVALNPAVYGTTPFVDLEPNEYYVDSVTWGYQQNITTGTDETHFSPHSPLTRQQLAVFLYRFAQYEQVDVSGQADLSRFPDQDGVASYARTAMSWAVDAGIIRGDSTGNVDYLNPDAGANRAQAATMIYRYLQYAGHLKTE